MNLAPEFHPVAQRTLNELESSTLRRLVSEIGIPPRPSLLVDLEQELRKDDPSMRRMADIVGTDVALSAALLRAANSPLMGLTRRAETVEAAFMLLGWLQCQAIFTEIALRRLFPATGLVMTRFWDVSGKRARAMTYLARSRRLIDPALAHTYGLFLDVGIPIMAKRFPGPGGYLQTLARANESELSHTAIEQEAHGTDHTLVGALAARSWSISQTVVLAVRLHHEFNVWTGPMPPQLPQLLALGLVSEHIIQRYDGLNRHQEWDKGGEEALQLLDINWTEFLDWCEEVHLQFDATGV
jgi:HD-like signal output (HDOD) protein